MSSACKHIAIIILSLQVLFNELLNQFLCVRKWSCVPQHIFRFPLIPDSLNLIHNTYVPFSVFTYQHCWILTLLPVVVGTFDRSMAFLARVTVYCFVYLIIGRVSNVFDVKIKFVERRYLEGYFPCFFGVHSNWTLVGDNVLFHCSLCSDQLFDISNVHWLLQNYWTNSINVFVLLSINYLANKVANFNTFQICF